MSRHVDLDRTLATIAAVDLDELGRRLHAVVELNRSHPSRPDGYPPSTPGASDPEVVVPPPRDTPPGEDEDDDPVDLTSVEAAVDARTRYNDPLVRAEKHAVEALDYAAHWLEVAEAHLRNAEKLRVGAGEGSGCWVMDRVGGWDPVHRTSDLAGVLAAPLDRPRPLGRWAYDFARRTGRLPSLDERRRHQAGDKVV